MFNRFSMLNPLSGFASSLITPSRGSKHRRGRVSRIPLRKSNRREHKRRRAARMRQRGR